jgi:IS4 transposase
MRLRGATCVRAVASLPQSDIKARVTRIDVHGSRATAAVDGFDRPLTLVREDGTWRVQSSPTGEAD